MNCITCKSERVASVSAKCNDTFSVQVGGVNETNYVNSDFGIGSDDYIRISYCLNCGQIQGKFPLEATELESIADRNKSGYIEPYECDYCPSEFSTMEELEEHMDGHYDDADEWQDDSDEEDE